MLDFVNEHVGWGAIINVDTGMMWYVCGSRSNRAQARRFNFSIKALCSIETKTSLYCQKRGSDAKQCLYRIYIIKSIDI